MTPNTFERDRPQFRWRWCIRIVVALLGLAMAFSVWSVYRAASVGLAAENELQAVVLVTRLVEEYADANNGQWPRSWDDLMKLPERTWAMYSWPDDFVEVQRHVMVDFTADPDELASQSVEQFAAIKPAIGYYKYDHRFTSLLKTLKRTRPE